MNETPEVTNDVYKLNIGSEKCNTSKLLTLLFNFDNIHEFDKKQEIYDLLVEYYHNFKNSSTFAAKYKQINYKNVGEIGRFYAYKNFKKPIELTQNNNSEDIHKHGAYICGIKREARNFICNDFFIDIDIKNCLPVLLKQFCEKKSLICPELNDYVLNRDSILKKYNVDKQYVCSLLFNKNHTGMNQFFLKIHNFVYKNVIPYLSKTDEFSKLYENRKKFAKKSNNFEGSFISIVLQDIEVNIIKKIIEQLNNDDIHIGAYMYDGLLLYKNDKLNDDYLIFLNNLIKEKLEYDVEFIYKNMSYPEYFNNLEEPDENFKLSIKDCVSYNCAIKILKRKDIIAYDTSTKKIWIKDEDNTWTSDEDFVDKRLKYYFTEYDFQIKLHKNIKEIIKSYAYKYVSIDELSDKLFNKDYMFFKNGGFSFIDNKFYNWKELDNLGIKTNVINNYNYIDENEDIKKIIEDIKNKIFKPIFNDDELLMNEFLKLCMRYLSGHYEDKQWLTGLGVRDTGKGLITEQFTHCFPNYIRSFVTSNLCCESSSGDQEYANKWLIDFDKYRIMIGNEIPEDKSINNTLLKTISSGGDTFMARKANAHISMYRTRSLPIIFTNDLPDPKNNSSDCLQNMLYFTFPCKFVDEPTDDQSTLYKARKIDYTLKNWIKNTKDIQISFFHYMKSFYEKTRPTYVSLSKESNEAKKDSVDIIEQIKSLFDIEENAIETKKNTTN